MLATLIGKNLLQRPLRYILTGLSIAFGVAAVTAVFIFTDGLRTTFDELGGSLESGFDISIHSDTPFGDDNLAPPVPVGLLDSLASIDEVSSAQPRILERGVIPVDGNGDPLIAQGPNLGLNWESRTATPREFIAEGRPPTSPDEFAIDVDGFADGDFELGGSYSVLTPNGTRDMELVGTFTFGSPDENVLLGAVLVALEEEQALGLLAGGVGYDEIVLVVDGEASDALPAIEALIATESEALIAVDAQQLIEDAQGDFGEILSIFRTVLLVFAMIILLVSAFLIFNVFTITLGQRIKELGLLRSVGAFGSQVTAMMMGEALILGLLATAVGIPAGWLLARALRFGLSQFGFPGDTGLPIQPQTLLYAVLVGVVVTLLAALFPSIRARQVTPIAALRDGGLETDLDTEGSLARGGIGIALGVLLTAMGFLLGGWEGLLILPVVGGVAIYVGVRLLGGHARNLAKIVLLANGLALLAIVRFSDVGLGETFGLLGAGALLTIVGASLVSGLFASPVARGIGMPVPMAIIVGLIGVLFGAMAVGAPVLAVVLLADGELLGLLLLPGSVVAAILSYGLVRTAIGAFGLTGRLARDNASRNPSRTATTATALMIGLALVTTVTIIGESIKSSVSEALSSSVNADWLIQGPDGGPGGVPFSSDVLSVAEGLTTLDQVVPYRYAFSGFVSLQGVEPEQVTAMIPVLFDALGDRDVDPEALTQVRDELGATDLFFDDIFSTDLATVREHIDPDFVELDESVDPSRAIWIEDSVASDRGLALGDTIVTVFIDRSVVELTVSGIYEDGFIFNDRVIDNSLGNNICQATPISS